MTESQLGWLAGMLDGEGTVGFYKISPCSGKKSRPRFKISCNIVNTHAPTIYKIRELVGYGRVSARQQPGRIAYVWALSDISAENFLRMIAPYCVTKCEQIDTALIGVKIRRESPRVRAPNGFGPYPITEETKCKLVEIVDKLKSMKT